jgi:hypothetical protein
MDLKEEVLSHFNEPVITGFKVGRVIGYAEDDHDCYVVIRYPGTYEKLGKVIWHTCVGGYHWLDRLKGQSYVRSNSGEDWDDFVRISNALVLNGCPEEKEPIIKEFER